MPMLSSMADQYVTANRWLGVGNIVLQNIRSALRRRPDTIQTLHRDVSSGSPSATGEKADLQQAENQDHHQRYRLASWNRESVNGRDWEHNDGNVTCNVQRGVGNVQPMGIGVVSFLSVWKLFFRLVGGLRPAVNAASLQQTGQLEYFPSSK
jgi:hypothetical protein